jgi:hypothetical protein
VRVEKMDKCRGRGSAEFGEGDLEGKMQMETISIAKLLQIGRILEVCICFCVCIGPATGKPRDFSASQ